jgi:hypothetical protein
VLLVLPSAGRAQAVPSAEELLAQAISWHDPEGQWAGGAWHLTISEARPEATGEAPLTYVEIDNGRGRFSWSAQREGARLGGELQGERCVLTLDGSTEVAPADLEKHRLSCGRLRTIRNYYSYLWGLPMKLRDPGTRLDPVVQETSFEGRPVRALRVTYEAGVGSDTWYFYLDRERPALVGYRFFHDEAKGDGEYVVLDGEMADVGLRLPRQRAWYTNQERTHLGTDTLVRIEPLPR